MADIAITLTDNNYAITLTEAVYGITVTDGDKTPVPENALLNDDGTPIINDDGSYILTN